MPIIIVTVPSPTIKQVCDRTREGIRVALRKRGTPREDVTVEFLPCAFPERLVVIYGSRHMASEGPSWADREAEVVGRIVERYFKMPVECAVVLLDKENIGLFLS